MRIALLSWESLFSVNVGGVAVHVSELARALNRKGHDVHVFTRLADLWQPRYECIEGVHYHRCAFDLDSDFVTEIENMCRSFVHALFETEDHIGAFDVVHAHDWLTAKALAWVKQGRGRKSIFTVHSTEFGRCGNNFFGGTSERIREIEWEGTYVADQVITVSNALRGEVSRIYSLPDYKSRTIYNGINPWDFDGWIDVGSVRKKYNIGPFDPMILFVGRMVYQKGPDLLLQAMHDILSAQPTAKCVFVGDGDMRWMMEHKAYDQGIAHATRFLGLKRGWELTDLYKAADCVVVPSRNEPFGIVILEAWAAGKPVVASVNGGPSEIVWHDVNGYKINDRPDSIAWGLSTLFNDMDHGRWMGHNGRRAAETVFCWNTIADETLATYTQ